LETIVDGLIYQYQSYGGVSRLFSEIFPRMCQADETLKITLLMSGQSRQALPYHPHIRVISAPRIERFLPSLPVWHYLTRSLKEWWLRLSLGRTGNKIWHSTYYTMPKVWNGAVVVTVHDMIYELFPQLFTSIENEQFRKQKQRCVLRADAVICVSETSKSDLLNIYGIDSNKVWIVPHGYSNIFKRLPNLAERTEFPAPGSFLLYVGGRTHYKNFNLLIKAYSLWQHRREVKMVVIGSEWSLDEMESLRQLDIYDQVLLVNNVDDETLCYLYNTAVAFVYPSLYEGFGIPLLEAMACGCPVVASRIPSTIEVAGDCPAYFDPLETESLVSALDKVLLEGTDSERSLAGLERVKAFSWERTAEQTLEVYHRLTNRTC